MSQNAEYLYDFNEDTLYLYKDVKVYSSIEVGEGIVLDLNKNFDTVALEVFHASKILSDLSKKRITKKLLSSIKKADLYSENKYGLMITYFKILLGKTVLEEKLSIQDLKYKSPVLAAPKFRDS